MTEAEYCDPKTFALQSLLRYLHHHTDSSDRKFRLFGVACCHRAAEWWGDPVLSRVIDGCERYADDPASSPRLDVLCRMVRRHGDALRAAGAYGDIQLAEFVSAVDTLTEDPIYPDHCADGCRQALCGHGDYDAGHGEALFQIDLLRDIFGNPFRPVTFAPGWRTSASLDLARTMYDSRDFAAMPILADALEEAGCDDADILAHGRGPGPHVRGCWVVDLVLGKS